MKKMNIGLSSISSSPIALGCMRIAKLPVEQVEQLIQTSLDLGIDLFDHADIYGGGASETVFGEALSRHPEWRSKMIIQTKCGIRSGMFDFSLEHILASVETSLENLQTDYIDILLLHRPDTLMDPREVAEAFDILYKSGKVKHFGLSNHSPLQIQLLQKHVKQPLIINQMQFSIMHSLMVDSGFNVNIDNHEAIPSDRGVLEYCRIHDITIQTWSPFQYGMFEGVFIDNSKFPELNRVLDELSTSKGVSKNAIAVAWILRHPANMQVVVGSTSIERISQIARATDVTLSREEWYRIYLSTGKVLP